MSTAVWSKPDRGPIGAVLVGGSSRRMGADKATLSVDGRPLGARSVEALERLGVPVVLLGGQRHHERALRRPCWPDREPGAGPMTSLLGLLESSGREVVALPCDLVHVTPEALRPLLQAGRPELVRLGLVQGRAAYPIGWWTHDVVPVLRRSVSRSVRSFDRALAGVRDVEYVALDGLDDVDHPDDLRALGYPRPMIDEIDIAEFAERRAAGHHVLDVREPHEYEEAHVPGANLIPLGEVAHRVAEVPADQPILVICRSGARSLQAATILAEQGRNVTNVAGGTLAWIDAGFDVAVGMERG